MRLKVSRYRLLLIAALLAFLLPIFGCDDMFQPSDAQLIRNFAEEWARSKNINPTNADGTPNFAAISNLIVRAAGGSTGDEQADAAVDLTTMIQNLMQADKLSNEGRLSGDLDKILKAIQMRPTDFTYRNSKGIAGIVNGDLSMAANAFLEADQLASTQGSRAVKVNLVDRVTTLAAAWVANAPFTAPVRQNMQAQFCRDASTFLKLTGDDSLMRDRPECR